MKGRKAPYVNPYKIFPSVQQPMSYNDPYNNPYTKPIPARDLFYSVYRDSVG